MSDFSAFSEDIENGMDYLEHFGILGMKWGKKNGPPYPLDEGEHSSGEKTAAKAAGVKVGSDSGKGSIENVKKKKPKPKKPLTPEEKREQALAAARNGDKKKIARNIDDLTTEELRDAAERARLKEQLTKKDPSEVKISKEDRDKRDVINSGDKELVKQYASKMSLYELQEAMNKVELMTKLNAVPPQPTVMDKLKKVADAAGTFKDVADKGIGAYNTIAKIYNATHKDSEWPLIGEKPKEGDKDKKNDKDKEKTQQAVAQVTKEVKKSLEEQYAEKLKEEKLKYKNEKELNSWKQKQEEKAAKKEAKKAAKNAGKDTEDESESNSGSDQNTSSEETTSTPSYEAKQTRNGQYTMERSQPLKKTFFNKKQDDDHEYIKKEGEGDDAKYFYKSEPTDEQKRLIESERVKDNIYLKQMKDANDDDYSAIFSDAYKDTQRNVSFEKAMEEYDWQDAYDYYLRHSEV